jgi:hypothetical protein
MVIPVISGRLHGAGATRYFILLIIKLGSFTHFRSFPEPSVINDGSRRALVVRLPMKPRTVEELRLIRRWIPAICAASYECIVAFDFFDLDFLRLLFPSPATGLGPVAPLRFRCYGRFLLGQVLPAMIAEGGAGPFISARELVGTSCNETAGGDLVPLLRFLNSLATVPDRVHVGTFDRPLVELIRVRSFFDGTPRFGDKCYNFLQTKPIQIKLVPNFTNFSL